MSLGIYEEGTTIGASQRELNGPTHGSLLTRFPTVRASGLPSTDLTLFLFLRRLSQGEKSTPKKVFQGVRKIWGFSAFGASTSCVMCIDQSISATSSISSQTIGAPLDASGTSIHGGRSLETTTIPVVQELHRLAEPLRHAVVNHVRLGL